MAVDNSLQSTEFCFLTCELSPFLVFFVFFSGYAYVAVPSPQTQYALRWNGHVHLGHCV